MKSPIAIVYTKEEGENRMICPSKIEPNKLDQFTNKREIDFYSKILGHKPSNLYLMYEGVEFKLFPLPDISVFRKGVVSS